VTPLANTTMTRPSANGALAPAARSAISQALSGSPVCAATSSYCGATGKARNSTFLRSLLKTAAVPLLKTYGGLAVRQIEAVGDRRRGNCGVRRRLAEQRDGGPPETTLP